MREKRLSSRIRRASTARPEFRRITPLIFVPLEPLFEMGARMGDLFGAAADVLCHQHSQVYVVVPEILALPGQVELPHL